METDSPRNELQEQLHEIERGESASWVVYPRTPGLWAVGSGLWAFLRDHLGVNDSDLSK